MRLQDIPTVRFASLNPPRFSDILPVERQDRFERRPTLAHTPSILGFDRLWRFSGLLASAYPVDCSPVELTSISVELNRPLSAFATVRGLIASWNPGHQTPKLNIIIPPPPGPQQPRLLPRQRQRPVLKHRQTGNKTSQRLELSLFRRLSSFSPFGSRNSQISITLSCSITTS